MSHVATCSEREPRKRWRSSLGGSLASEAMTGFFRDAPGAASTVSSGGIALAAGTEVFSVCIPRGCDDTAAWAAGFGAGGGDCAAAVLVAGFLGTGKSCEGQMYLPFSAIFTESVHELLQELTKSIRSQEFEVRGQTRILQGCGARGGYRDYAGSCNSSVHMCTTGLHVLAQNRRNSQVNFIDSGLEVVKRDFRHFSGAKECYSNGNVRFENFMHTEWSEENFLKRIVGGKRRLHFWNKHQTIELLFMQLARYSRCMKECWSFKKQYQKSWLINKIYQDIKLMLYFSRQHISIARQLHEQKIYHLKLVSEA